MEILKMEGINNQVEEIARERQNEVYKRKPLGFLEKTLIALSTSFLVTTGVFAVTNPLDIKKICEPASYAAFLSFIYMGSCFYKDYFGKNS